MFWEDSHYIFSPLIWPKRRGMFLFSGFPVKSLLKKMSYISRNKYHTDMKSGPENTSNKINK